jgi:Raf kinase inhibitor-like YbhB/YbcL family protein
VGKAREEAENAMHSKGKITLLFAVVLLCAWPAALLKGQTQMKVESPAFAQGQPIPAKHTCEGADVSPLLRWSDPPAGTKTFALIVDDPDAPVGDWVHWVIYNLPAQTQELPEGVPKTDSALGGIQGRNDFKTIGYQGPCPPPGKPHRYFFKLAALDAELGLKAGASKKQVEEAMQHHVLGKAELMGTYQRKK